MPTVGVEFAKVSYTLADGRVLLRDISLQLEAGTTTALLGRSGSGKTTLLRMVNDLVTPTSGKVRVAGKATQDYDTVALRRSIGYVIQETGLFPHMTVERNAGMALELAGRSKEEITARVREVLALAGLDYGEFRGTISVAAFGRAEAARGIGAGPGDGPNGAADG